MHGGILLTAGLLFIGPAAAAQYGDYFLPESERAKYCNSSVSFTNIPNREFLPYRDTINGAIHWYINTARQLSSGSAMELENILQSATASMEQFRADLKHSVVRRERIADTMDQLMTQFDTVVKTADILVNSGKNMLSQHERLRKESNDYKTRIKKVLQAADCDLRFIDQMEKSPETQNNTRIGKWAADMRQTISDSMRNITAIRADLQQLEISASRTMEAIDQFVRTSLQGVAHQFATSATYVFTSFRAMQTSRQYVRMEIDRIRFPSLKEITERNIEAIEERVGALAPQLQDLEKTFLGQSPGADTASWKPIIGTIRKFEQELDRLAADLEDWSLRYWSQQLGKEVRLTCDLMAYRYDAMNRQIDKDSLTKLKKGSTVRVRNANEQIGDEKYVILDVEHQSTRMHSPIHSALAVLSASQSNEVCRRSY